MDLWKESMLLDMSIHMAHIKCNFLLMEDDKMHPGQMAILLKMRENGPSNQRMLAKELDCSPASIGVSMKRMEKAGLVRKAADPKDSRGTRVELTEQGRQVAEKNETLMEILGKRRLAGFQKEEIEILNGYLMRIKENLKIFKGELAEKRILSKEGRNED